MNYIRPLSLVFGLDARRMIAAGDALALGGLPHIGFTHVEEIARGSLRRTLRISECQHTEQLRLLSRQRPAFGGLAMDRCRIMGIVNVTPDSFSDGGRLVSVDAAVAHGVRMMQAGADILDVGGESTRPGSDTVEDAEELRRVVPVVEGLAGHVVSIDTRKSAVMAAAIRAGARIVNDVSALGYDAASASVVAKAGAPVILMHAQGEPRTMQLNPQYDDVVLDVYDALARKIAAAEAAGISRERICVDPGIGFGKTFQQNLQLMAQFSMFHGLGVPVLMGLSRKGVVGAVTGEKTAGKRAAGSVGGALAAAMQGAHIVRVHDVEETVHGLKMFTASCDPDSVDL